MSERDPFKVDLRGIVDVFSNHLYSSPTVFVRELLQNAIDAITARHVVEPSHNGEISIRMVGDGVDATLSFEDDGIGLDEADVHVFLSTIGQSSKRDSSTDFLGQFGIGILSCFVVSDEVTLVTRKLGSSKSLRWIGHSDGTYELASLDATAPVGTAVDLRPNAELTPDWAYFVRCVVNVNELRPTAGREAFYEDAKLEKFREEIGQIVRAWLEETGRRDPDLMAQFIRIHYMALKALATQDPEFYELFVRWLPFEGTRGMIPLGDYLDCGRDLHFVSDHDAYRQLAGVARALGIELIDGGFSYDAELLSLARDLIGREIRPLDDNFLMQRLAEPTPQESEMAGE